MNMLRFG